MSEQKRFTNVDFPSEYPFNKVADHEVLMSFLDDQDAFDFREWWEDEGSAVFLTWLGCSDEEDGEEEE